MNKFSFVHAADLHLDATFVPVSVNDESKLKELFSNAPFIALDNIVKLCIEKKVSFLLLAGDIYNVGEGSLKARFALQKACQRLEPHGIEVFWARGNHDPLSEKPSGVEMPANLTIFKEQAECYQPKNLAGALICGISHRTEQESEDLSLELIKLAVQTNYQKLFKIALLHTAVGEKQGYHAAYAPSNLSALKASKFDYWALGHIHLAHELSSVPRICYAGASQGLNIKETGAHGCLLVEVDAEQKPTVTLQNLAPIRFEIIELDLEELENKKETEFTFDDLLNATLEACLKAVKIQLKAEALHENLKCAELPQSLKGMVFRLKLIGRSSLNAELQRESIVLDLKAAINKNLQNYDADLEPGCLIIKDIQVKTNITHDFEIILQGNNLKSEALRSAVALKNEILETSANSKNLLWDFKALQTLEAPLLIEHYSTALAELLDKKALQLPAEFSQFSSEELIDIIDDATRLCLNAFEVE